LFPEDGSGPQNCKRFCKRLAKWLPFHYGTPAVADNGQRSPRKLPRRSCGSSVAALERT
jgi:hypothetical protein